MTTGAPILRGRAAQPVRPGLLIREVLSGEKPLIVPGSRKGEVEEVFVSEACMTDLHFTYKTLISRENQSRPRHTQLRGMTQFSYAKVFRFAKYLGLLEFVREEDMRNPPPGEPLLQIFGRTEVKISKRKIYQLSSIGQVDEVAWTDLRKAWQEKWPLGRKLERPAYAPPPETYEPVPEPPFVEELVEEAPEHEVPTERPISVKPKTRKVGRPPKKAPGLHRVVLSDKISGSELRKLVGHLRLLNDVGLDDPRVRNRMSELEYVVADWQTDVDHIAETARIPAKKLIYIKLRPVMVDMYEAVLDSDIPKIVSAAEKALVVMGERRRAGEE